VVVRVAAVVAALLIPMVGAAGDADLEYRLKAEFVERFTRFVTWPGEEQNTDSPFVIGVFGSSPIESYLERLAADRLIQGRPARLVIVENLDQIDQCHLLFLADSASPRLPAILERTSGQPILTVSDCKGFCQIGVLINLFREGEYLRFEVNLDAVERSGLHFSSNLLRLARLVRDPT
jgi:hypothetical protein